MSQIKLNLGCGDQIPEGWINVDYAIGARFAKIPCFKAINKRIHLFRMEWSDRIKIHDLRRPFPFDNGSVDVVYSSHTLEHFTRQEGQCFLKECHRVLRPDGILRVVVPDLAAFVSDYTSGMMAADAFVDKLGMTFDTSGMGVFKRLFANQTTFSHKCMYDAKTLLAKFREIGFQAESRNAFESEISDIYKIENEGRTRRAAIVEGRRVSR